MIWLLGFYRIERPAISEHIAYAQRIFYGIKKLPCCVRDCCFPVLSQQVPYGNHHLTGNAIDFGQGSACEEAPALLMQVQNFAAHGMAGAFFNY